MKQKLFIFLFLILLGGVLVALNAASYVQKQKTPDSEMTPNRSTFHFGATGTNALYALLSETGRRVTRWQDSPSGLAIRKNAPAVFVVIGSVRRDFTDADSDQVLQRVAGGGRLVLIDREPPPGLVSATANWKIRFENRLQVEILSTDPSDQKSMTAGAAAVRPIQPTLFTRGINAVQPSRFASSIDFERFADDANRRDQEAKRWTKVPEAVVSTGSVSQIAPVVHFAGREHALLIDAPYGSGSIVFLSDPYIVSNGGIGLVDNARLAINILSAGDGLIAFDEYHQGY